MSIPLNNEHVVLCCDQNGTLLWHKKLSSNNPLNALVAIEHGESSVGIAYQNSSGSDVYLERLSTVDGSLMNSEILSSTASFNLQSLFVDNERAYFGGELSSEQSIFSLGEIDFLNLNANFETKSYLSYIFL